MIDRNSEQHNAALASALGINPPTVYCNVETGIKITECIPQAETLNGKTATIRDEYEENNGHFERTS